MLRQMRQLSKSWVSSVFLGVLALSFAIWGIADVFHTSADNAVAYVGSTPVSADVFQRDYQNFLRNQSARSGSDITPEQARAMGVGPMVLQQLITQTAADNLARRLGLTVSDAAVAKEIRGQSAFAGVTGTFDHMAFLQRIGQAGFTEQGFIETVRQDMAREQMFRAAGGGLQIPAGYALALYAFSSETRAVHYIVVTPAMAGAVAPPSDAVLAAYVKAHAAQFSTPEYRDVTYAWLTPDDVMGSVKVTDAEIKAEYERRKSDPQFAYDVPEKRDVEQITYPTEAAAKAARARIAGGESFEAAAAAQGLKPADADLGLLQKADLEGARGDAAFALKPGDVSAPVKGPLGWVLLKVTKIEPGKSVSLADATADIRQALAKELAQSKLTDAANAYTDAVSGGASLAEAAKKAGLHFGHVAAMDANGLAPNGSKTAAPDDPDFRAQAFKSGVGDDNDPFQSKSGALYVLLVNGSTPPHPKPLAQVHDAALAAWTAEETARRVKAKAEALAADAMKAKSLDAAAKSVNAAVAASPALTRGTSDDTFSPALVADIFRAAPGGIVTDPAAKGGAYIVAQVTGIAHAKPAPGDPVFAQGIAQLSHGVADDLSLSLANAVRAKDGVKVNQKLVDQVVGSQGS